MGGKLSNPRGRDARAQCMNFFFENLRNPARSRRAGLMRQFRSGQLDTRQYAYRQRGYDRTRYSCTQSRTLVCTRGNICVNLADSPLCMLALSDKKPENYQCMLAKFS
jgi:hypothetical protein